MILLRNLLGYSTVFYGSRASAITRFLGTLLPGWLSSSATRSGSIGVLVRIKEPKMTESLLLEEHQRCSFERKEGTLTHTC